MDVGVGVAGYLSVLVSAAKPTVWGSAADVVGDHYVVDAPARSGAAAISRQAKAQPQIMAQRRLREMDKVGLITSGVPRPGCSACDWTIGVRRDRSVVSGVSANCREIDEGSAVDGNFQHGAVTAVFQIEALPEGQEDAVG